MKERNQKRKNSKGITLIALVITIIVLLILAAVSIAMLTGENGILTNAQRARTETTTSGEIEQLKIAFSEARSKKLRQGNSDAVVAGELQTELDNDGVEATVEENSNPIKVTFDKTGNTYTIDGETGDALELVAAGETNQQRSHKDLRYQKKIMKLIQD